MEKTDRAHEVARRSEQIGLDPSTGDVVMAAGSKYANPILFRDLPQQLNTSAKLKFGVAVEIKSECRDPDLELEITLEQMRIIPENFTLVAALGPFGRRD